MMLMIMMCPVEAWKNEKNTIFKKTSEVIIARSKWLITMVVDLAPYRILLDRLKSEIIALKRARNQVADNYVHQEGYIKLLYSLEQESRVMESQWKEMNLYLRGIGLLQSRPRRAVIPIVGKALSVLFGTVSEEDVRVIRRKLSDVERNQKPIAQVARESLSTLNITRVELSKNRVSINWLTRNLHDLQEEVSNITESVKAELQVLDNFIQQYFQLLSITARVRQTGQSLMTLLEHVRAQLDSLSLGHLSPSIMTPNYLREILTKIQTELPPHLRLPVDPTEELWRYYSALGCVTLMEGDKLLILMSVPLLDRDSTFEIYQVINLPIPYPRADQEVGAVARYRLETEYIALNLARNKFMMLPEGEANKCKTDALRTCTSTSPIYVTGNYNLCVLELFKGDKGGIRRYCRVEILADVILPQAISICDGVWAVATQREIDLSMVCEGKTTQTIKVIPPLTMVELPLGCSAFGISMSLPPYYQAEEKFEKKMSFSKLMENNLSNWAELWEPIVKRFPTVTLKKIPELLKPMEKIGFEQLKAKLDTVRETGTQWMIGTQLLMNWSAVLDFGPERGPGKGTMADLGPLIRHLVSTRLPSGGRAAFLSPLSPLDGTRPCVSFKPQTGIRARTHIWVRETACLIRLTLH